MNAILRLIRSDFGRARGALMTSGFGIVAGTAALVFFLALGFGVRAVLLGEVFPIDQVELEPPKGSDPGVVGLVFGGGREAPGIEPDQVKQLRDLPYVGGVFPKLKFSFPASARGGKEILGREVGTSEMIADGIDPSLVTDLSASGLKFEDPLKHPGKACMRTDECDESQYCEGPAGESGVCVDPVPVLVSRYLVEFFDKSIAPAHGLPPVGETMVKRASGIVFKLWLGESLLGKAKRGSGPRHVKARVVGISPQAIDIGITLPLDTVRRWNREYTSDRAAENYSSVLIKVTEKNRVGDLLAQAKRMKLTPTDTRARDVSVLLSGIMALLALVAAIILIVSASNIAYTFRGLVSDRQKEIALYRAVGASARDMNLWMIGLSLTVGLLSGAIGVFVAWLLSLGADRLGASKLPDFPFKPESFFAFPPELIAGGIGFAALFALLGAVGPARRAGKVEPANALSSL